mmetsp:Transcript_1717/g.3015  ORF Transcript_1717/g.3015 Transcript_1717/m.3015 type:complete len:214 (+) Transcript_1717:134-775(+)
MPFGPKYYPRSRRLGHIQDHRCSSEWPQRLRHSRLLSTKPKHRLDPRWHFPTNLDPFVPMHCHSMYRPDIYPCWYWRLVLQVQTPNHRRRVILHSRPSRHQRNQENVTHATPTHSHPIHIHWHDLHWNYHRHCTTSHPPQRPIRSPTTSTFPQIYHRSVDPVSLHPAVSMNYHSNQTPSPPLDLPNFDPPQQRHSHRSKEQWPNRRHPALSVH